MSFFGLTLATNALDAFQVAENVTSENTTNANTPGASRQLVQLTESSPIAASPAYPTNVSPGTVGTGVSVAQIQRIHQNSFDALYRNANSSQNYYDIESQQLQLTQADFSEPNGGISSIESTFQTAVSQWASNPTTSANGTAVISDAQNLASSLNGLSNQIAQQKTEVAQAATAGVAQANGYIDQIATLNGEIRATTAAGDNANTYEDQRDQLIDELSQLVSVQTSIQPDGSALVTVNGQALVNDTTAFNLSGPVFPAAANGAFTIGFANDPNQSDPAPVPLGSGQLAAYQDLYNNKLTSYSSQLDTYASSLASTVNSVLEAGYNQSSNPGSPLFGANGSAGGTITASNISVLISNPNLLAGASVSTGAGTIVQPISSANNTVDPSTALVNSTTVNDAPTSVLTGTITVTLSGAGGATGQTGSFSYNMAAGGNSDSINDFLLNFNQANLGVQAAWNATTQTVVFTRNPNTAGDDPNFTLSDSNADSASGPATSLLQTLGAGGLADVATAATANTITVGTGLASAVQVGNSIVVDAGTANAETVQVTGVNATTGLITVAGFAHPHGAGSTVGLVQDGANALGPTDNTNANGLVNALAVAPSTATYGDLVTQLGLDAANATTASTTQQTLVTNLNSTRQSVDGINLDEETNNLVMYQQAYQTAAQTFNILNSLIGTALTDISGVAT